MAVTRVDCTVAAANLLADLREVHGDLLFHQSGGCCDGSAPMCYPRNELRIGSRDVLLGHVGATPFFIGGEQFELWKHTHLTVDVVPGRGSGFSVESPLGVRFLVRSRLLTPDELRALEASGPPLRGPEALEAVG